MAEEEIDAGSQAPVVEVDAPASLGASCDLLLGSNLTSHQVEQPKLVGSDTGQIHQERQLCCGRGLRPGQEELRLDSGLRISGTDDGVAPYWSAGSPRTVICRISERYAGKAGMSCSLTCRSAAPGSL